MSTATASPRIDRGLEMASMMQRRRQDLRSGRYYKGVSDEVAKERLDTCLECPDGIDSQALCLRCGCDFMRKRWVAWWRCPAGKFEAVNG